MDLPVLSPQVAAHRCFPDEGSQLRDAATGPFNLGVKPNSALSGRLRTRSAHIRERKAGVGGAGRDGQS